MAKKQAPAGAMIHYNGVRMRLTGSGSLQMTLYSLDEIDSYTMIPFTMAATTAREPTRLANFKSQRASLEFKTTLINETFRISKIVIFAKAVEGGEFPG
jgi:hypothetical protein